MPIIPEIISQHAEESAFLWTQRDNAVKAPHYSLKDLAELDDRVEANIDGLRIAGDEGLEVWKDQLSLKDTGEVFTAALLAFETNNNDRIQESLALCEEDPHLARGVISAIGWLPKNHSEKYIHHFLSKNSPLLLYIGISASVINRRDPEKILVDLINHSDPLVKNRALKAIGELKRKDVLPQLVQIINKEKGISQFYAAKSALLLGVEGVIPILQQCANQNETYSEEATSLSVRRMRLTEARQWLKELSQSPEHIRKAIQGMGAFGDPAFIPMLISYMDTNEIARVSGESFSLITGIDLAYDDLEKDWPEEFEAGPNEDPDDDNVAMDEDEDLPWPDSKLITSWWDKNKSKFKNGTRYLMGKPITDPWLNDILKNGFQRQRSAAALELALRNTDSILFETRAPGFLQQKKLSGNKIS